MQSEVLSQLAEGPAGSFADQWRSSANQSPDLKMHPCFIDCGVALGSTSNGKGRNQGRPVGDLFTWQAPPHFNIDVSPGYVKTAAIELSGAAGFSIIFKAGADRIFQPICTVWPGSSRYQFSVIGLGVPFR